MGARREAGGHYKRDDARSGGAAGNGEHADTGRIIQRHDYLCSQAGQPAANIRDRRIRQEYDGTNTRALALKYDVSESWVKRIASIDERGEIRGQTSLFDG
ncbi:MAG: Mor transcription activator family protein [Christensenellales bacterium]